MLACATACLVAGLLLPSPPLRSPCRTPASCRAAVIRMEVFDAGEVRVLLLLPFSCRQCRTHPSLQTLAETHPHPLSLLARNRIRTKN